MSNIENIEQRTKLLSQRLFQSGEVQKLEALVAEGISCVKTEGCVGSDDFSFSLLEIGERLISDFEPSVLARRVAAKTAFLASKVAKEGGELQEFARVCCVRNLMALYRCDNLVCLALAEEFEDVEIKERFSTKQREEMSSQKKQIVTEQSMR